MDDKTVMEGLLLSVKNACDLYLHGAIEASTPQVRREMRQALTESLDAQDQIYAEMTAKGWYANQQAPGQQVDQTRQKYQSMQ